MTNKERPLLSCPFVFELDGDGTIHLDEDELSVGIWMPREEIPDPDDNISLASEMTEAFRKGTRYPGYYQPT